MTVCVD